MRLKEQVAALDAEAATWQLLWHLHGVSDAEFPAGTGGPSEAGRVQERSVAQRIASILAENQKLNW